jgi:hypothetical protein
MAEDSSGPCEKAVEKAYDDAVGKAFSALVDCLSNGRANCKETFKTALGHINDARKAALEACEEVEAFHPVKKKAG